MFVWMLALSFDSQMPFVEDAYHGTGTYRRADSLK